MSVTDGRQLKAGRVILDMTIDDMAEAARLNRNSVLRVEAHETLPISAYAAERIQRTLEDRGIAFIVRDGLAGVLFKAAQRRGKTSRKK